MSGEQSNPKHRRRAVEAIADHFCATDFTDGFCSPRDGKCHADYIGRAERNCMHVAEGCVRAMETRGIMVSWPYDKATETEGTLS